MNQFPRYEKFLKPRRAVRKVFLHCSASDHAHHDNPETVDQWHKQRGWSGIGYHFFISKNGAVFHGRGLDKVPAAQEGHNTGSIAICCHGKDRDKFTKAQMDALHSLCRDIDFAYDGKVTFHGHCEVANKACPVFDYKRELSLDQKGFLKPGVVTEKKLANAGSQTISSANAVQAVATATGTVSAVSAVAEAVKGPQEVIETVRVINGVASDAKTSLQLSAELISWLLPYWPLVIIALCAALVHYAHQTKKARIKDEAKIGRLADAESSV